MHATSNIKTFSLVLRYRDCFSDVHADGVVAHNCVASRTGEVGMAHFDPLRVSVVVTAHDLFLRNTMMYTVIVPVDNSTRPPVHGVV